jgi:glycosyltransferase involved in cell wall biosynthesis
MGSGLPCLAVGAGGVLEFARHGRNAWLVGPNNAPALAQGLRRLLQEPALRQQLAAGGLATAAERSWDEVYDRLLQDYQDAITARSVVRAA